MAELMVGHAEQDYSEQWFRYPWPAAVNVAMVATGCAWRPWPRAADGR